MMSGSTVPRLPVACWLWSLMLWSVAAEANSLPGPPQDCEVARMKCAYRSNCAQALHGYMVGCADVLAGRTTRCPWSCRKALIKLTSTEMGLALSNCECGDNEFCLKSKERAEICRPEVSHATADDTVVSCSVAEWICAADSLCSTALDYYHRLCRPMFHGRKCNMRCNNSLNILDRQEKATKLRNCYCDGTEDFPCLDIKINTQRLCYGREEWSISGHQFPQTTPKPYSGSRSQALPCCNLLCSLLCLVVLWTFRTSIDVESDFPVLHKETFAITNRQQTLSSVQKQTALTKIGRWPWWWTSEGVNILGS